MASISLNLKPFDVPSEVTVNFPGSGNRQDGMQKLPTLKLNQLSQEALDALISEFAEAVMAAAAIK